MLEGNGLLALWNGVDPARAAEYHLWHTREHVPERVSVPGMIRAFRYVDGDGPLPSCLTLYDLQAMDVLTSAPYRALLENPTEWSRSMRPSFRGFLRLACRPVARGGGGTGGAVLATTLGLGKGLDLPDPAGFLRGALSIPAVTGAHLAETDPGVPSVPFTIGGDLPDYPPDYPQDAVLVLEGYSRRALEAARNAVEAWLAASPLAGADTAWTSYALGYAVAAADLPHVVVAPRQAPGQASA